MEKNITKKWNKFADRDEWYCVLPSGILIYIFLNLKTKKWCLTCGKLHIVHCKLNAETLEAAKTAAEKWIARYMRQKIDTIQYDIDALVGPKKTFRVGFNNGDETEFDVDNYAELMECLVEFFAENGIKKPQINYIDEFEYEGEASKMPYATLSDADRNRIGRINARNDYGISASQLRQLGRKHKNARNAGDIHTMELIEYRLTDINFHHECSLLSHGEYDQLNKELKDF